MSKYPNNPYWDQESDDPLTISARLDWDEVAAQSHITAEHVLARIENIAVHEFGHESVAGFDSNGFFVTLIAEGLPISTGIVLRVYSKDHNLPHVHIEVKGSPQLQMKVSLVDAKLIGKAPAGWAKKIRGIQRTIRENQELLEAWWEKGNDARV